MTDYRRNRVPGHTFFFTVRLIDNASSLLTEHINAFGEAIRHARGKKPFHVDAWVVLHDHAHAIWTLPPGDYDCASRWRAVKIAFSKSLRKSRPVHARSAVIWQRHFQEYPIRDEADYRRLVDYVHDNPVSHGLCQTPSGWPWSSVHRFVAEGFIDPHECNPSVPHEVPAPAPSPASLGNAARQ